MSLLSSQKPFLPEPYMSNIDCELPVDLRTLADDTPSPKVLLQSIFYSIQAHQEAYTRSQRLHDRISPSSICIPTFSAGVNPLDDARRFLFDRNLAEHSVDERFRSLNRLMANIGNPDLYTSLLPGGGATSQRGSIVHIPQADYLDDLESYWYVLAYFNEEASGKSPGATQTSTTDPILVARETKLSLWTLHPRSFQSITKRKRFMLGSGFPTNPSSKLAHAQTSSSIISTVLSSMHETLNYRYTLKLLSHSGGGRVNREDERLLRSVRAQEVESDYANILDALQDGIEQLELCELRQRLSTILGSDSVSSSRSSMRKPRVAGQRTAGGSNMMTIPRLELPQSRTDSDIEEIQRGRRFNVDLSKVGGQASQVIRDDKANDADWEYSGSSEDDSDEESDVEEAYQPRRPCFHGLPVL